MSHEPECDLAKQCPNNPAHDLIKDEAFAEEFCYHCGAQCECPRLRACEARVREERADEFQRMENAWRDEVDCREQAAWEVSDKQQFANGVQAARDAVAAVEMGGEHFWSVGFRDGITIALAAIDGLRG